MHENTNTTELTRKLALAEIERDSWQAIAAGYQRQWLAAEKELDELRNALRALAR
ncbi:hypothetical protein GCM10012275_15240 [Longimycelium tulufanense]|uniref:Uncharacterized protein n=1 Tax=Longimycelium tulufanense TaxID=907463 RepID=A0A8J3CDQ6_9PSEU|nr:hypothetical protein [Longimycelium tulufanense]GGM45124.1 hypothetical protein GCM10012275_15240 [Longimycelium tulufanense]